MPSPSVQRRIGRGPEPHTNIASKVHGNTGRALGAAFAACYVVCILNDIPDARDGLTRQERIVLLALREAEAERKGRGVRAAMLYGRVLERTDMGIDEFMRIVERLSGRPHRVLTRSQQQGEDVDPRRRALRDDGNEK
jgi:hypothetical protein